MLVVCACCFMQNDCWRHIRTLYVNYIQGKLYYACLSGFRWTFIILHCWWCFSHDLDMVEIERCQLRDTRLNVQSPFALPRISTSYDNQWTVDWHTWLPYKTNQFHVQREFLFSSKRPVLVRAWQKYVFVSPLKF